MLRKHVAQRNVRTGERLLLGYSCTEASYVPCCATLPRYMSRTSRTTQPTSIAAFKVCQSTTRLAQNRCALGWVDLTKSELRTSLTLLHMVVLRKSC